MSATVRIVVVVCATIIVLGVVGALVLTGSPVDAGALLTGAGVLLCGLLYGASVMTNGGGGNSGGGNGIVLLVALAGISAAGCGTIF
jgi:hypothetical protein